MRFADDVLKNVNKNQNGFDNDLLKLRNNLITCKNLKNLTVMKNLNFRVTNFQIKNGRYFLKQLIFIN